MVEVYQRDGTTTTVKSLEDAAKFYEDDAKELKKINSSDLAAILYRLPVFDHMSRVNMRLMPSKEKYSQAAEAVYRWRKISAKVFKPQEIDEITKLVYNVLVEISDDAACQFFGVTATKRSVSSHTMVKRATILYLEQVEFFDMMAAKYANSAIAQKKQEKGGVNVADYK